VTDQTPPDIFDLSDQFRAGLLKRDKAVMKRIISNYQRTYKTIQKEIELLTKEIEIRILSGKTITQKQAISMAQYDNLMISIEEEIGKFGVVLKSELSQAAEDAIAIGVKEARGIVAQAVIADGGGVVSIRSLDPAVVEQLLGFLTPESALWNRIDAMPEWTASQVSDHILDGVALGRNPKVIAEGIVNALGGSLTDAMRMARTAQLYAYREASRATYIANADIVEGWIWHSALDDRTCPSCIAMHGKKFPLSEKLNDHYNGRCAAIPVTFLNPDPDIEKGTDWFDKQDEETQKKILGPGRYEAWKEGKFQLSDIPTEREDSVYGMMRVAKPLKDLSDA